MGFIVADGMGGHLAGEEASRIAVEMMLAAVSECISQSKSFDEMRELLTNRIVQINDKIMDYSQQNLGGLKSGTTLSVGIVLNNVLHIAHVGDCRVYLVRKHALKQLTQDHSYVAELLKGGLISSEQAIHHPDRNRITRALGFKDNFYPDFYSFPIVEGDAFIFCTDGLYEHVTDQEMMELVLKEPRDNVAKLLIEKAKDRGGSDNITVIMAWM
jgi:protein phosphatase